ncbi:hypothetical protein AB0O01_07750 [Streptomyces sp. NPDC093252]|uniref:hypothetical protein n=1 Tax=Streptomyces sp. NPDC093252 TaxID=3154980 RepID=UPI00342CE248
MQLKKTLAATGLAGMMAAGALMAGAAPASAAANYHVGTHWAPTWDGAKASCQSRANSYNATFPSSVWYYCAQGAGYWDSRQKTWYSSYNLWMRVG